MFLGILHGVLNKHFDLLGLWVCVCVGVCVCVCVGGPL